MLKTTRMKILRGDLVFFDQKSIIKRVNTDNEVSRAKSQVDFQVKLSKFKLLTKPSFELSFLNLELDYHLFS